MKYLNKLINWILENYILVAALLGMMSFLILHQGAKKRGEKTKIEISTKVEDEIEQTLKTINEKFTETFNQIDNNTKSTIINIQNQGTSVIDKLSNESKKEVKEVQLEMDKLKVLSEKIIITNSPIILELKYVIPIEKISRDQGNSLGYALASNFDLGVTITRKINGQTKNIAQLIGSPDNFTQIDLSRARSYPINFSKENTYVVHTDGFWTPEEDNYYITLYCKLLPSELIDFTSLNKNDNLNIIRTQKFNISQEFPGDLFYNIEPEAVDC
nr:hypothetical protein [uncultured Draconibacterium sp.]